MTATHRGAYGLRLGSPIADRYLVDAAPNWPLWHLRWRLGGTGEPVPERIGLDEAVVALEPAGHVVVERLAKTSTLVLPKQPVEEAWALLGWRRSL